MISEYLEKLGQLIMRIFGGHPPAAIACDIKFNHAGNGGIWTMGNPEHRKWVAQYLASKTSPIGRVFASLQNQEASTSGYQNYDNQGATFGTGFGGRGMAPKLAMTIGNPDILPYPADGNRYTVAQIDAMRTVEFARKWVCTAESVAWRERIADAQASLFVKHVSSYGFPEDDFAILEFLSHLSWWYPALLPKGGWPSGDAAVIRALQSYAELASKYGVRPSRRQLEQYIAIMAKHGHSGDYSVYLTPFN